MLPHVLHKRLFSTKHGFIYLFLFFLFLFSIGMGAAIYLKQHKVSTEIALISVIVWQMAIWLPLVIVVPATKYVLQKTKTLSFAKRLLLLGCCMLILVGFHFGWFYSMSSLISPYLGLPKTKYGVYPYFFIFWIMIDIVLVSGLVIYLENIGKATMVASPTLSLNSFYIKKGNKRFLLKPEEILWIGAEDYYIKIYTTKGRFLERKSLKSILDFLPTNLFIRIHRSTVVNINAITKLRTISGQKAEVSLKDGNNRSVSRTYLKPLKDLLSSSSL